MGCVSQAREKRDRVRPMHCDKYFMFLFWKVFIKTSILEDSLVLEDWYFETFHHLQVQNFR